MSRRVLSHAADTGIEARSTSLEGVVEEVLEGMSDLVARVAPGRAGHWVEVEVAAEPVVDALFDVLSELIYRSEVEHLHFCAFRVHLDGGHLIVEAGGVPSSTVAETGPAIKAVTYHGLEVTEEDDGSWRATVYFDV